jgi:hypothetical protein
MFNAIIEFFDAIGRARAATHLANHGYYELAKSMTSETPTFNDHPFEVHP